jgi:hypothetical protein
MGTFSKSLASIGGFIAGDKEIINWLKHTARSYIFQASSTPSATAAALEALHILQEEPERIEALWEITNYALERFRAAGFEIGAGINLGKNEHWVNMQASINYSGNKHSEKKETDSNGNVIETEPSADQSGLKYNRISVPVELLVRLGGDGYKPFYIGVGAVYYQNMNGKLIYMREEQKLNDGINAVNFAGRVSVGGAMKIKNSQSFGLKAYLDIDIILVFLSECEKRTAVPVNLIHSHSAIRHVPIA